MSAHAALAFKSATDDCDAQFNTIVQVFRRVGGVPALSLAQFHT